MLEDYIEIDFRLEKNVYYLVLSMHMLSIYNILPSSFTSNMWNVVNCSQGY